MSIDVSRLPFDPGPAAWDSILPAGRPCPTLETEELADFLVVGGGFAGLTAARRLQQLHPNARIALLEARRIAEGPAGRNSGFMIDLPHNLASKDYAGEANKDLIQTRLNREAIAYARDIVADFDISNEAYNPVGKINAAATQKGTQHNLDYAKHLTAIDEDYRLLDSDEMKQLCGSSYYQNGLYTPGTVMLQPALYIRSLAEGISARGISLYENSPVIKLENQNGQWVAKTPKGSIEAGKVILATNGHVESFGFYARRLMHIYLYASMTRPLSADEQNMLGGEDIWGFTPADPMGTTVRKINGTGGCRIVVRNRFTWSPGRTVSESRLNSIARVHDRSFINRFPMLGDVEMEYRWGGLLCLSLNNTPAFGELEKNLFSACCQNGLGTALGTLSGKLIADMASNEQSDSLAGFLSQETPKKLPPEPFSSIGANAYMRWGEFKAGAEL